MWPAFDPLAFPMESTLTGWELDDPALPDDYVPVVDFLKRRLSSWEGIQIVAAMKTGSIAYGLENENSDIVHLCFTCRTI